MGNDKLTEFVTVLVYAMAVGAVAMFVVLYLEGAARIAVLVIIVVATVLAWQYLRKRFSRG